MTHLHATAAAMPTAAATTHRGAGATHGAHLEPKAPAYNDPRFIRGSVGEPGQSETIKQESNPGFLGIKGHKQNDNDRKQNNYNVTDANFNRFLGVIADPDTGRPMSYMQTQQAYNAAGAIKALAPDAWARMVANQDAGRGTVLGASLYLLGITKTVDPAAEGVNPASIPQELPGLGSLRDYVTAANDFKGREWNRAHHGESHWVAASQLVQQGFSWQEAALFTGDSMTSWSGRVLGSNNQDGSKSGFAADELAGLKFLAIAEQATGKDILTAVLGSHADTHLPVDKLTNPKINKLIGFPENDRSITPQKVQALRQWALGSGVEVKRGEFMKFLEKAPPQLRAQIDGTGLLSSVRFKVETPKANGGGGGGGAGAAEAVDPTGLGTGQAPAASAPAGIEGNVPATAVSLPGAGGVQPAADGAGALGVQLPVAGEAAPGSALAANGALAKAEKAGVLSEADMSALLGAQDKLNDAQRSAALIDGDDEEKDAAEGRSSEDGGQPAAGATDAKAGASEVGAARSKRAGKGKGKGYAGRREQAALRKALQDGRITKEERASLAKVLGAKGRKALDDALKAAGADGRIDGAAAKKLIGTARQEARARVEKLKRRGGRGAAADAGAAGAPHGADKGKAKSKAKSKAKAKAGATGAADVNTAAERTAITAALADGKVTKAERTRLKSKLTADQKRELAKAAADGKVTAREKREVLREGSRADARADRTAAATPKGDKGDRPAKQSGRNKPQRAAA